MNEKPKGPTIGVHFREVSTSQRVREYDWRTAGTNTRPPFQGGDRLIESENGIHCSTFSIKGWTTGFICRSLQKQGLTFRNLQFYVFQEDKRIFHCTRQSSDIQWIIDISTGLGSQWLAFMRRVFIHLYLHNIVSFPHLYLMPLPITELKRVVDTMLRYQLAATVFCTEYDLKPSIKTLNYSFKIVLSF